MRTPRAVSTGVPPLGRVGLWTGSLDGLSLQETRETIAAPEQQGAPTHSSVVAGVDAIRSRVAEHLDAGASHVCLQVLGPDSATAPVAEWEELAAAVVAE